MLKSSSVSSLALLVFLTACGGSSQPTQPTPTPTPTNRAPVINSMSMSPSFGIAGFTQFAYSASASDLDNDALTYTWDVAGNARTGSSGTITFSNGGAAEARVTVTDGRGGSVTDTRAFVVGTMTGNWTVTSGPLAGATFNLTQNANGVVTGTFVLPGIGTGNTDPAQPGSINANGNLTMRVKVGAFTDFNMSGSMSQTGRTVNGTLHGSGFTGQPFSMTK